MPAHPSRRLTLGRIAARLTLARHHAHGVSATRTHFFAGVKSQVIVEVGLGAVPMTGVTVSVKRPTLGVGSGPAPNSRQASSNTPHGASGAASSSQHTGLSMSVVGCDIEA